MKQINYTDAAYILNYKQHHLREKYLCNWYMELRNCNVGFMECRLKWWTYASERLPGIQTDRRLLHRSVRCFGYAASGCEEPPLVRRDDRDLPHP